jgi:hypothetical protein
MGQKGAIPGFIGNSFLLNLTPSDDLDRSQKHPFIKRLRATGESKPFANLGRLAPGLPTVSKQIHQFPGKKEK